MAQAGTHEIYENVVMENRIESNINTKLDTQNYCMVDNSLEGTAGMKKTVVTRKATGANAEALEMGVGNTTSGIKVTKTSNDYTVMRVQDYFDYYDEEAMADPKVVEVGVDGLGNSIPNWIRVKTFEEWRKTENTVDFTGACPTFDDFVDAQMLIKGEDLRETEIFAICNKNMKGALKKSLKDDLKYVEGYVKTGYFGTVAGIPIIVSDLVGDGEVILGTKEACTLFIKKGTEIENVRDADTVHNTIYARKYALVALTDENCVVKMTKSV